MSTTQNEKDKTDNHPTQELIPKKKKIVKISMIKVLDEIY